MSSPETQPDPAAEALSGGAVAPTVAGRGTMQSIREGVLATRSFFAVTMVFGLLFGSTAASIGMPPGQALAMSALVMAGSVQFPALGLWAEPLPLLAIAVSSVLVSSRHILMGMTMAPMLRPLPPWRRYAVLVFLTDANWVLIMAAEATPRRLVFFVASGASLFVSWLIGTSVGLTIPDALDATTSGALASAGTLILALLMVMLAKGYRGPRSPWVVAGLASVGLGQVMTTALALPIAVALGAGVSVVLESRRNA